MFLHHFNAGIFSTGLQPNFFFKRMSKNFQKLLKRILSLPLPLSLTHTHTLLHANTLSLILTNSLFNAHTHTQTHYFSFFRIHAHIHTHKHTHTQAHTLFCKHKDKNTWQRNLHVRKMEPKVLKEQKKQRRKNCAFRLSKL